MEHIVIYMWIFMVSTVTFNYSYVYSGVTKTFSGLYKSIFEACVINFSSSGKPVKSFFRPSLVETKVRSYFDSNITRYVKEYTLDLIYYDHDTGEISEIQPTEVDVYLTTTVSYIGTFTLSNSYYIGMAQNG